MEHGILNAVSFLLYKYLRSIEITLTDLHFFQILLLLLYIDISLIKHFF